MVRPWDFWSPYHLVKGGGGFSMPALGLRMTDVAAALTLPSPYSSDGPEMVHPSVVYRAGGWNGYNRWMAATPYPNIDVAKENPCILVSNDGVTWEAPPGLTNPLVPPPADVGTGGYNSDPHLVFSPNGAKLYLIYRYYSVTNPNERLMLCESTDGINWSSPVAIYSTSQATRRLVSPSMWWDGVQWVIVAHDIVQAGNPLVRMVNGGGDPYTGWPAAPSAATAVHPLARSWWHSFFMRQPNGSIVGLLQDNTSGGGLLYQAYSSDNGQTFSLASFDLTNGFYRSCFVILSATSAEVYVGRSLPAFEVRKAPADFARVATLAALAGAVNDATNDFYDAFERADAASLGSAPSGQAYTVNAGSFGIAGGLAYNTTTGNNRALADLGAGGDNVQITSKLSSAGDQAYITFRAIDGSNYWRLGKNANEFRLQKITAGSITINHQINVTPAVADLWTSYWEIIANGTDITILVNGQPVFKATDSGVLATQRRVGIQASGTTASYFAELVARKL